MEDSKSSSGRPSTGHSSFEIPPMTANRPQSRKKYADPPPLTARTSQRGESRMGERERPASRVSRLQSAARPQSSFRQGSAMRVATALHSQNIPHHAVNVMDRPVTQQGVSGLRTAKSSFGNRRQIHDKSYYLGLIRTKMTEIGTETNRLNSAIDSLTKEQSTYMSYEKRVKELAAELIELQGELQDYNILSDMITSGKDKGIIEEELRLTKKENEEESKRVEDIYNRRREAEKRVAHLEILIQEERNKANDLIQSLEPKLRSRYEGNLELNNQLQSELQRLQDELDNVNSRRDDLLERVSKSELKRRVIELEEELLESEDKRDSMARDAESSETPEEERERLLNKVKADNADISTLERQITETNEELRILQEEIRNLNQELEENDSGRQQKYRELKRREEEMEEFMIHFDENKEKELENLNSLEKEIFNFAERISRNIHLITNLPEAGQGYTEIKEDLTFKEEEFDKAKYTAQMVGSRNDSLRKQLDNFENLEEKMKLELATLEKRMEEMKTEMERYSNLDEYRTEAGDKIMKLKQERITTEEKSRRLDVMLASIQNDHDRIKEELDGNEVRKQISTLEKKWSALEESNYTLSITVNKKRAETDYEGVKKETLATLNELNLLIQIK